MPTTQLYGRQRFMHGNLAASGGDYGEMRDVRRYAAWQPISADQWMGSNQTRRTLRLKVG
jgi:hypothetical protein